MTEIVICGNAFVFMGLCFVLAGVGIGVGIYFASVEVTNMIRSYIGCRPVVHVLTEQTGCPTMVRMEVTECPPRKE